MCNASLKCKGSIKLLFFVFSNTAMKNSYQYDQIIVDTILKQLPEIKAIYRYGSAGTIYEREESDIDIAVLAGKELTFEEISKVSAALMEVTSREIDLLDLTRLPVTLKVQIVLQGSRLYSANRLDSESYETYVLSDYVRLNEERQGVLKDISQSGQIYG